MRELSIDAAGPGTPLPKFWQALGCDHLYQDTRSGAAEHLFARIGETGAIRYLRNHHALSDEMADFAPVGEDDTERIPMGGGIYHEDDAGRPAYDFSIMDQVYDRWVAAGIRPIVEMDRVPSLLRAPSGPVPVNDFARWTALISAFTEHLLARYGEDEVLSWYFECYNEPDRMPGWVHNLLYDHFVAAVTRVHPRLRVGGPAMWTAALGQFLEHVGRGCDQVSGGPVRIDYVSSHRYAMSADETRNFPLVFPYVGDLVRWVEEYWAYARTFPRILEVPFHLNEWGLIGRYAWGTRHFRAMELRDTEYAGLFLAKLVTGLVALEHWRPELGPERGKTPDLILYWGFAYEASRGTFLGNRSVLTAGPVLKPIWAVYEMLARLGDERLDLGGAGAGDRVAGLATRDACGSLRILLYHFAEGPEPAGAAEEVRVRLDAHGALRPDEASWYLLDREHGNTFRAWEAMGRPGQLAPEQLAELRSLERPRRHAGGIAVEAEGDRCRLTLRLPAQSVSLLEIPAAA
ncbi:MAG: hypothetical protein OXQ31_16995 [Spirochaetaceae bacterium]|nr:hypothetical protein [Spirochaetaceae bacterium]